MSRALRTSKHRSKERIILDHLQTGKSITAYEAVELYGELNLRNKISNLRKDGWQIHSDSLPSENGGQFKRYYLNMEDPRGGADE